VSARLWQKLQQHKLAQVREFINPEGATAAVREQLKEAGERMLLPLDQMREEMDNIWSKVSEQTQRLQRLCR